MLYELEKWDKAADVYTELPDVSNVKIIYPAIIRRLGDVCGKRVLDYGCGHGRFVRQLADLGADVIGVDLSPTMISIARVKSIHLNTEYHHMEENNLSFLPDESVDAATAILVFMMAPDAEEIQQSMEEIRRILRPGGRLIYAITHPCFVDRGAHDYRNVFPDGFVYMKEDYPYRFILQDGLGREVDEEYYDYHHRVSTYVNITVRSGFKLTGMEELSYPDVVAMTYNVPYEFQMFPQSLLVEAQK